MSRLYLPWGSGERYTNRLQVRNQFASTLELHRDDFHEPSQRQRSPSLPPIHQGEIERLTIKDDSRRSKDILNRNISSSKRFSFYDEDAEGDTSGYGSETLNHMSIRSHNGALSDVTNNHNPVIAWQQITSNNNRPQESTDRQSANMEGAWSARSGRSPRSTTAEEGRPRWGDRGVATGRLWEPTAPNARLPQMQNQKKGTPSWVERGLNMIDNTAADILVINQGSPNSALECDRSLYNGSDEGRTYLRGQNVPLEPEIKADREIKRMKALELQTAILNQLEEQEKKRQEERENKLREEKLEELRIQRQQDEDKLRLENEKRRNEEKRILEQQKLDTLKKALEDAEMKARQDREKKFVCHKHVLKCRTYENNISKESEDKTCKSLERRSSGAVSPSKTNRTYDIESTKSNKEYVSHYTTEFNSPRSIAPGISNSNSQHTPCLTFNDTNPYNVLPIAVNTNSEMQPQNNGIQLAVLLPQNLTSNIYNVALSSLNNIVSESVNTEKILTPRKYRNFITKDASTQTELNQLKNTLDKKNDTEDHVERDIVEDYSYIDENAPKENHNNVKKDRRFRSEDRYKKNIENRPKWGVNRPAAQYKKQSEKDPFYSQKRKTRQKYRTHARQYVSQSSDDSRSPSPLTRSDKSDINKQRHSLTQSYWKNKRSSQDMSKVNISTETGNLVSEFTQIDQITLNEYDFNKRSPEMSPSKRMTLSQKFINDKYGNRKLWADEANEKSCRSFSISSVNRKNIIDQINLAKKDYIDRN